MESQSFWDNLKSRFLSLSESDPKRDFHVTDSPAESDAEFFGRAVADSLQRAGLSTDASEARARPVGHQAKTRRRQRKKKAQSDLLDNNVYLAARAAASAAEAFLDGRRGQYALVDGPEDSLNRESFHSEFCSCVVRGAIEANLVAPDASDADAFDAWIDALRAKHLGDGDFEGVVDVPCQASAALCEAFATEAYRRARASGSVTGTSKVTIDAEPNRTAEAGEAATKEASPAVKRSAKAAEVKSCWRRAAWLRIEMRKRGHLTAHSLAELGGPDEKTIKKILNGLPVHEVVIERLAEVLSSEEKEIGFRDIPTD